MFLQLLFWGLAAVFMIFMLFLLGRLLENIIRYFSGLHKLPQPSLSSRNPLTILLWGHALVETVLKNDPKESCQYFNSLRNTLKSKLLVLAGPSFSANVIVFSASAICKVSTSPSKVFSKPWAVRFFLNAFTGENSIFDAEGTRHCQLRNAISTTLKHDNLAVLSPYYLKRGDALTRKLANGLDPDPILGIRRETFDTIFHVCFGQHVVNDDKLERILYHYHNALTDLRGFIVRVILHNSGISFLPVSWAFSGEQSRFKVQKEVHQLCSTLIACPNVPCFDKKEPSDNVLSLLSIMRGASDDDRFSTEDVVQTVLSFLFAGQATTTIGTAWAFYFLAAHRDWQTRVHDEIYNSWKLGDDLSALDELPLLNRVVKESLRLYPPIPNIIRKVETDVSINGHSIPAGTLVRVTLAAIHRCHDFWGADANDFNPDRFIGLDNHPDMQWLWTAFWFGPRSCVGQRFAILEIKSFIATMLLRYRIAVDEQRDGKPFRTATDESPRNLKLYYTARETQSR